MNHRQLIARIARRFPDLTKRQIEDVLDVLTEVCQTELSRPDGRIVLRGLGVLFVERQTLRPGGFLKDSPPRSRIYFRFRPTPEVRQQVESQQQEAR